MRHFVIELTYTAPLARMDEVAPDHRAYLQPAYDSGHLLYSGRQVPPTGGIIPARFESREALDAFIAEDPYNKAGVAEYRVIEFSPTRFQPFMQAWSEGA